VASITNGQNAANVLGQADFTSAGSNTTQSRMANPGGLAYDAANSRLFEGDNFNYRVLVFNVASINQRPKRRQCARRARFHHRHRRHHPERNVQSERLAYDAANSRLFEADYTNSRVLVFNVASITNGQNAANVLGQADFTTGSSITTQSGFNHPYGLAYDAANSRLFEGDYLNARVLVFNVSSITNGQNAVNVLGQTNFTNSTPVDTRVAWDAIGAGL